jgi:hypothetical protein
MFDYIWPVATRVTVIQFGEEDVESKLGTSFWVKTFKSGDNLLQGGVKRDSCAVWVSAEKSGLLVVGVASQSAQSSED